MIMATSKDFQIIHKRYQKEGLPHGVSIIRFCQQNGIIYKQYERWLKNRNKHWYASSAMQSGLYQVA